jgi:hypothetical protein
VRLNDLIESTNLSNPSYRQRDRGIFYNPSLSVSFVAKFLQNFAEGFIPFTKVSRMLFENRRKFLKSPNSRAE